jgi:thiosulfate/3-mercaptopyruvate sulfurtransferase
LEPWEKVLVDEEFFATVHGDMQCTFCHGGTQSADMETAHAEMTADPSEAGEDNICATCHLDQTEHFADSLHVSQAGYWDRLDMRSVPENHAQLETMFGNHCSSCHTSCGDCHISQPNNVGGGFVDGHVINKTPSMSQNCTACHGSRVGAEYTGKHEDIPGDAHFRLGRMNCMDCHSGADMHDSTEACLECHNTPESAAMVSVDNRYSGAQIPSCESCHEAVGKSDDANPQHLVHGDKLACQVCHTVQYTSCDGCHVAVSEKTGNPFFETQATYFTFYIGKNPDPNYHRPYEYVVLRHVPVDPDSYDYYGEDLLPNFNSLPTWTYATPHNVQRKTPQNASCTACHGNADIFLTADKIKPEELEANQPVIVPKVPALP